MSGDNDSAQEKSFDASDEKIRKSREKGDIPQPTEANTLMAYVGLFILLVMGASWCVNEIFKPLNALYLRPDEIAEMLLGDQNDEIGNQLFLPIARTLLIIMGTPALCIILILIAQRGIVFSADKITPKISKIDPISNAKKKFGPDGMVEFLKKLAKVCLVFILAMIFFYRRYNELPALSLIPVTQMFEIMRSNVIELYIFVMIGTLIIVGIDVPYAYFSFYKKLRMSFQEVKDEQKESEGDPHLKAERRRRAMEISQRKMLKDVPKADVVIVNPTHYAVALKWSREAKSVPVCVAKGVDNIAARIREIALENDIAIYSNPPTARSLYALIEIGDEIEPEHYAAVAAAIHYADKAKRSVFK